MDGAGTSQYSLLVWCCIKIKTEGPCSHSTVTDNATHEFSLKNARMLTGWVTFVVHLIKDTQQVLHRVVQAPILQVQTCSCTNVTHITPSHMSRTCRSEPAHAHTRHAASCRAENALHLPKSTRCAELASPFCPELSCKAQGENPLWGAISAFSNLVCLEVDLLVILIDAYT